MRYPVNFISISKGYHLGKCLDFGWWKNEYKYQNIYAVADATVYKVEKQKNGGNVIYLKHNNGVISCYAHLDKVLVKKNQNVKNGDIIGTMGATGNVTGMHLHFGLYSKGKNIYGNADLDPFEECYLYDNQIVRDRSLSQYTFKKYESYKIKYVYNCTSLNVRSGAGINFSIVSSLKPNDEVKVYEIKNNWARIGENRWVSNKYLSDTKIPSYPAKMIYNCTSLNVRNKPSVFGKIVGNLKPNTKVSVYKTKGSWSKISSNEEKWVSSKYLK